MLPFCGTPVCAKAAHVPDIACASPATNRLYVSTIKTLQCFDLLTDKILWEKTYEGGCDRMSITPDGKIIYLPSFEGDHWLVIDALDGSVVQKLTLNSRAHNTIIRRVDFTKTSG